MDGVFNVFFNGGGGRSLPHLTVSFIIYYIGFTQPLALLSFGFGLGFAIFMPMGFVNIFITVLT